MTNTTPPEGHENHNPDAPTERIDTEHTDAEQSYADTSAPEPTTVAEPIPTADESVPASEHGAHESATDADTAAYVPGEPVDYEPVSSQDAPTEKVERITTVAEPVHAEAAHAAPIVAEPTHAETARDEAVAQKKDYTPEYVPTAVATTPAAGQTVVQPTVQQQQPTQQFAPTPIYVTAPTAPKTLGNRAAGILIGLIATAVFAGIYALVAFFISAAGAADFSDATSRFTDFLVLPVFYLPVIFFFLAFALLVSVLNRAGWWAYVLGGFLVAVIVYFSYIGGALLAVQAWTLTGSEAARFISTQWLNPGAIAAAIVAREVPIWFGAWIARRGRSVTAKNVAARQEYERQLAEGPQLARP
ncbi:hypothetical protein [Cryobacterium sp. AP23]